MRAAALALLLIIGLTAGACAPALTSPWSGAQVLAPALQFSAPAAAEVGDGLVFVWSGFDAEYVHQDARPLNESGLQPAIILPLPPSYPFEQRLISGHVGAVHLFWLDAAAEGEAGNRLYSALLGPDLTVLRGPVAVSNTPTYHYAVLTDGAGGAWTAWTGGHPGEPTLSLNRVDAEGRPGLPVVLGQNSQHPALVAVPGGDLLLFHLSEGQLQRLTLRDGAVQERANLTAHLALLPGDAIEDTWAAPCGAEVCVGWNVIRSDASAESWWTAGPGAAAYWPAPRRVEGLTWLTPASPAPTDENLYAAAARAEGLVILTIRNGAIVSEELAAPGVQVYGRPGLADRQGTWWLTWAAPGPAYAELRFSNRTRTNAP